MLRLIKFLDECCTGMNDCQMLINPEFFRVLHARKGLSNACFSALLHSQAGLVAFIAFFVFAAIGKGSGRFVEVDVAEESMDE